MIDFGELKRVPLREIWPNEPSDFTPWLAENIEALGEALKLELELTSREASVGDFSLDLLAKDLDSSKTVIIENQLSQTNHDHLGKLLTYAAGFDASIVIWIAKEVRDEHRQALEWVNQKTDTDTQFFGVEVEVLKIDDSRPAFNFKAVVFPNEWQKSHRQKISASTSPKGEKYREYFQRLIDELRETYDFTGVRRAQPQNWYAFTYGVQGIYYYAWFTGDSRVGAALRIEHKIENLFGALEEQRVRIHDNFESELEWDLAEATKRSTISVYRDGDIESTDGVLDEIKEWHIHNLLKLKKVFTPEIERALETIGDDDS